MRLLEAAARVFSLRSYDDASMDDIAHEAGVGKPTLYRYFPSKDALFAAVFVEALDRLEARLEAVLDQERDLAPRLFGLVQAIVPTFRDHLVPLRFLGESSAAVDQSRRRIFRDRRARIAGFLIRAIEDGVDRGEARPVNSDRIAHLMIGMIWGGAAGICADDGEIAREIAGLVLQGVGEPAAVALDPFRAARGPAGPGRDPATLSSRHEARSGRMQPREATIP
ncbi:TetR/AcrR family transcriptional regulator [uncultured Enterovirga sp.]|uniref:TetR/AcrR family transcriptional regulator n=1 Tax=uncultured Enterovirga sp. TaxID=2026352 RepID=UPI0035C95F6C